MSVSAFAHAQANSGGVESVLQDVAGREAVGQEAILRCTLMGKPSAFPHGAGTVFLTKPFTEKYF